MEQQNEQIRTEAEQYNLAEAAKAKAIAEAAEIEAATKYFKTNEIATSTNYPYGRLRTTAYFGTEFKPGKGYRTTFQTVNPKTGRINKVKKSTYSHFIVMKQDLKTGFISYDYGTWYDKESNIKLLNMLSKHHNLLTAEQIEDMSLFIISMLKVDFKSTLIYCVRPENQDKAIEKLKEIYKKPVNLLILQSGKEGNINLWKDILNAIDFEEIEAIHDEGYNPFKTTHYRIID